MKADNSGNDSKEGVVVGMQVYVERPSQESAVSPLDLAAYRPYLSSPIFHMLEIPERRSSIELLNRFYSDKRIGGMAIEEKLIRVLEDRQWRVLILYGDCGIGKT